MLLLMKHETHVFELVCIKYNESQEHQNSCQLPCLYQTTKSLGVGEIQKLTIKGLSVVLKSRLRRT